jgi:hypothetical protein
MNDPALDALAGALRGLTPGAGRLDRDALMFRAGRASAPRRRAWPLATAASAAAALALGVLLWARPELPPRTVERVVYLPAEVSPPASERPAVPPDGAGRWSSYLQEVARWDLDGRPPPPEPPDEREGPPTVDALLRAL